LVEFRRLQDYQSAAVRETEKTMRKRRKIWIIGLSVGVPVLAGLGLLIALLLSGGGPRSLPPVTRDLPSTWRVDSVSEPQTAPRNGMAQPAAPLAKETTLTGVLAFSADGREFGEESYEIQIDPGQGIHLVSSGTFRFKVVLVTVSVPFSQELRLDATGRPVFYRLQIDGVLGIGRRQIDITVTGTTARVASGDTDSKVAINPDRLIILGTFSTYALVPALLGLRPAPEAFDVLTPFQAFGSLENSSVGTTPMRLEPARAAVIRAGNASVAVDRRTVDSSLGESTLWSVGNEFLGFTATGTDGSLRVYRSDYFPRDFEVVDPGG
jgi:hypothetical protein